MPDPEAQPCKYMTLERRRSRELASRKHGDADFPTREALAETLLQVANCWECPEIASIAINIGRLLLGESKTSLLAQL
jgi:hypothetical protein